MTQLKGVKQIQDFATQHVIIIFAPVQENAKSCEKEKMHRVRTLFAPMKTSISYQTHRVWSHLLRRRTPTVSATPLATDRQFLINKSQKENKPTQR